MSLGRNAFERIEQLRKELNQLGKDRGTDHNAVLELSQQLDELIVALTRCQLDQYWERSKEELSLSGQSKKDKSPMSPPRK